jgi:type I restriction enzyme M protein
LDRNLGLTNPLNEKDLEEFVNLYTSKKEGLNSWSKNIKDVNKETWDLTVNNPNIVEEIDERTPIEIMSEIEELNEQEVETLKKIKELL